MAAIEITSFDPQVIKDSLIPFLQSKPGFEDFNFEGSALNTIIDLLTRNTHYIAFMANMVGNESFLDSAQVRGNVVSHAQKLSYTPKSRTSATAMVDITVIPSTPSALTSIIATKGSTFINTIDGVSYNFVNTSDVTLFKNISGNFVVSDVELKQGQFISQKFVYDNSLKFIEIKNANADSSTFRVFVRNSPTDTIRREFKKLDTIINATPTSSIFYLSEDTSGFSRIEFGKGILGEEPINGSVVEIEYIVTEDEHGNGITSLIAATPIGGFSNIQVTVTTEAFGGAERDSIDRIRFVAPRVYKAQNRTVVESDYVGIALREFPFIKSISVWGGEKNDPPFFGRVFMAAIPVEGFVIANAVKRNIESRLSEFAVGSITPVMIDPTFIGLNLDISIIYDPVQTSDTFNQVSTNVQTTTTDYNTNNLKSFDLWYNDSILSGLIKNIPGVKTVEIDKEAYSELTIVKGSSSKYSFNFFNKVIPGSFRIDNFVVDVSATSQNLVDDEIGNLNLVIVKGGITTTTKVGTIDYENGNITFTLTFLSSTNSLLNIYVTPETNNFYTDRNYVVFINSSKVTQIPDRRV